MKQWLIAAALAAATLLAGAQPPSSPPPGAPAAPVSSVTSGAAVPTPSSPAAPASAVGPTSSQPDQASLVAKTLPDLKASLSRIEGKLPSVWWLAPLVTLISVVIGGLVSGGIAYAMQATLLKHQQEQASKRASLDEAIADKKARDEVRQAKFDWQVRQLTELYGPLRALFDGSNEVYRRMNEALIVHDPHRYRDLTLSDQGERPKNVDPDGRYFETYDEAMQGWRKFRTIMDWNSVYRRGLGVDGYFDRIVDIGARISTVVGEKSGLVMPNHGELLAAFGRYLAHFEVLRELHAQSKVTTEGASGAGDGAPLRVREAAAFPNRIQELVRAGSDELLAELANWSAVKASGAS